MFDINTLSYLIFTLFSVFVNSIWYFILHFFKVKLFKHDKYIKLYLFNLCFILIPTCVLSFIFGIDRLNASVDDTSMMSFAISYFVLTVISLLISIICMVYFYKNHLIILNLKNLFFIGLMLITQIILQYLFTIIWFFSAPGVD